MYQFAFFFFENNQISCNFLHFIFDFFGRFVTYFSIAFQKTFTDLREYLIIFFSGVCNLFEQYSIFRFGFKFKL